MTIARTNGWARPTDSGNAQVTGRTLSFYTVSKSSVDVGYAAVGSDFEKLVLAIETVGSIELLGTPSSGAFRVAISGAAPAANTTPGSLEGICNAAVSGTTVASYTF
jgi:hypothetical protein